MDFQEGAEGNRKRLQGFEDVLISRLRQSCARQLGAEVAKTPELSAKEDGIPGDVLARVLDPLATQAEGPPERVRMKVLDDPEVLGSALDMVGAYLKNYEVDRAARVIETVLPVCRRRGGLWLLKTLNHLATVRMKQARPNEALAALQEVESQVTSRLQADEHDEAWEFWETIYRNFGWVLSDLEREEEAVAYIKRAIDVKERVGRSASWFDLWDLGRMKAASALRRKQADSIKESLAVVKQALRLHQEAEKSDLVMRAKLWHTVGECSFALGHLAEQQQQQQRQRSGGGRGGVAGFDAASADGNPNACCENTEAKGHYKTALKCFSQAHKLLRSTEGPHNPLTGGEAQAAAWTLLKLGNEEEAKGFLMDALEALSRQQSGWGDGEGLDRQAPALAQAMQTVERILEAHRRTGDRAGLTRYFQAVERLCSNIGARLRLSKDRTDAAVYEKLISSCSMIMVASGTAEGADMSQQLLRRYMWNNPETPQAKLCNELMLSLQNGEGGDLGAIGSVAEGGPGMRAFIDALAKMS